MESLPPEICQLIFSFACTDGGFTGLSLARVSRYTRNASAPVRFQRMCIRGAVQLRGFAATLDANGTAVVQHLFLADHISDISPPFDGWEARVQPEGRWTKLVRRAHRKPKPRETRTFLSMRMERDAATQALVVRILARAAPKLRSLVLCLSAPMPFMLVPPSIPFPMLAELWNVHGTCTFVVLPSDAPASAPLTALRRLHLAAYFHHEILLHLPNIAPELTHLRFSDICAAPTFPDHVEALLNLPAARTRREAAKPGSLIPAPLPPSTQHVAVQPADEDGQSEIHRRMADNLRAMPEKDMQSRLIFLEEAGLYRMQRAREDWLEQMGGKDGCWRGPYTAIDS